MQEANNQTISAELDQPGFSIREQALDPGQDTRLKRLAAAVILQAVSDLTEKGSAWQRHTAFAWFAGKRDEGLSFEICCKMLDRNTDDTRRKLEAYSGQALTYDTLAERIQRDRASSAVSA